MPERPVFGRRQRDQLLFARARAEWQLPAPGSHNRRIWSGLTSPEGSSGFAVTRNSAMPTKQHVLCLIDSRREICRPSLIGMQFLYQRTVRATDLFSGSPGLKAKDLIGLL